MYSRLLLVVTFASLASAQQASITITAANGLRAPFLLDGTETWTPPMTFNWDLNSQHTIQWLTSSPQQPGTRYIFQGWSDGDLSNSRTIDVATAAPVYIGDIKVQYLLTTSVSPPSGGTVAASPSSPDGYYDSGTNITFTAQAAPGFVLQPLATPAPVTLNSPMSLTIVFECDVQPIGFTFTRTTDEQNAGFFAVVAAPACVNGVSSDSDWLTIGPVSRNGNFLYVPYTVAANTGAERTANISYQGLLEESFTIGQVKNRTPMAFVASVTPSVVTASDQLFTIQAVDSSGAQNISAVTLSLQSAQTGAPVCEILSYLYTSGGSAAVLDYSGHVSQKLPRFPEPAYWPSLSVLWICHDPRCRSQELR